MHGPLERGERPLFEGPAPEPVSWPDEFPSESAPEFRFLSPPQAAAGGAIAADLDGGARPLINRDDPRPVAWSNDFPAERVPEFQLLSAPPAPATAAATSAAPAAPVSWFPITGKRTAEIVFFAVVVTLGGAALVASIAGLGRLATPRVSEAPNPNPPVQVESLKMFAPPPPVDVSTPAPFVPVVEKKPATPKPQILSGRQPLIPAPKPAAPASQPPPLERVTISPDPTPPVPDPPAPRLDLSLSKPVSSGVPSGVRRGSIDLAAPPASPRAEDAIQAVLDTFRRAYAELDAESVGAIWPTVNTKTLGRAFDQLSEQHLEFDVCSIETSGTSGQAYCAGRATFVPRVGNKTARVEPRQWTFRLKKVGNAWLLDAVEAR